MKTLIALIVCLTPFVAFAVVASGLYVFGWKLQHAILCMHLSVVARSCLLWGLIAFAVFSVYVNTRKGK